MRFLPCTAVFLLSLSLCPALHADATRQDWFGTYTMDNDGHPGTLQLSPSTHKCAGAQCTGFDAQYTDLAGLHPARVTAFDQSGQHLALTIAFPGNSQPFDLYIFSFEKSRLAGTTVWQGRTFGVSATRAGSVADQKTTSSPAARKTIAADGTVTEAHPDGSTVTYRIGSSQATIRGKDGTSHKSTHRSQVRPDTPPDPPPGSAPSNWLQHYDDLLLSVLQTQLDAASYQNYLNNYENAPGLSLYKQIGLRSSAIIDLLPAQ